MQKTADEGGTLVHFKDCNFEKPKVPTKVTTRTKIPDFTLVDGYTTAGTPTPEGDGYPTLRRLCLSIPGSTGDHKDVEGKGAATVSDELDYPVPPQDGELRLLGISPAFKFTRGGAEIAMTDPWAESGYHKGGAPGKTKPPSGAILESSSGVSLGSYGKYGDDYGLMKVGDAVTTCKDLAARYGTQLGRSRVMIFKAMNDIEGKAETIQTYEPRQSWGINQWTSDGELWQILAFISDFFPQAFARRFGYFGFGIWFASRKATWRYDSTYEGVIPYRVPCCGPKTRSGIDALFPTKAEVDAAAAAPAPTAAEASAAADKPPVAMQKMANAFAMKHIDATSFAFSYVLTAAGADQDIQKAQAQWMSYRITSVHTSETMTNQEVYYAFQADLRPDRQDARGPQGQDGRRGREQTRASPPCRSRRSATPTSRTATRSGSTGRRAARTPASRPTPRPSASRRTPRQEPEGGQADGPPEAVIPEEERCPTSS